MLRREQGMTTIESVVALSLLAIVMIGTIGLHMLATSVGAAAESSSIATNLARARMEELLAMSPSQIADQDGTRQVEQVPPDGGRSYTIVTSVNGSDRRYLDITVAVSWQNAYNPNCAEHSAAACRGSTVTYTRTLQTRLHRIDDL
jgi:Tfp pilus assembly protein PilV